MSGWVDGWMTGGPEPPGPTTALAASHLAPAAGPRRAPDRASARAPALLARPSSLVPMLRRRDARHAAPAARRARRPARLSPDPCPRRTSPAPPTPGDVGGASLPRVPPATAHRPTQHTSSLAPPPSRPSWGTRPPAPLGFTASGPTAAPPRPKGAKPSDSRSARRRSQGREVARNRMSRHWRVPASRGRLHLPPARCRIGFREAGGQLDTPAILGKFPVARRFGAGGTPSPGSAHGATSCRHRRFPSRPPRTAAAELLSGTTARLPQWKAPQSRLLP